MTPSSNTDHLSRSISLLCASYRGDADFIAKFRALARRFDGVDEVLVLAAGEERSQRPPGKVFASAPVRVMGEVVGEVQVFIRIASFRDSSPLPLTKFLARQLGIALQFGGIHSSRRALEGHRAQFETQLREHRLLERASGLMESRKLIPAGKGARLIEKASRQSGRAVGDMADGIVATASKNPWKFRREFWA